MTKINKKSVKNPEKVSPYLKSFFCEKHKIVGMQGLTVGVFIDGNYVEKTFCGLCHFEMLSTHCQEAVVVNGTIKKEDKN